MGKNESLIPLKMLLFTYQATNTILISFLPLYLHYKGLSGTEIGWVLAIGPLASIIAQPFWGFLSDKYKTVKRIILICMIGIFLSSIAFFQMDRLLSILFVGFVLYFFTTPVSALGDSLGQRRANDLNISFGTIRMWGSLGFATSSLVIGQILNKIGVQYMMWPYIILGCFAFLMAMRLKDVHIDSEPVQFSDVKNLITNKPYVTFLLVIILITITHRTNDSFIGLYVTSLGGTENLVGVAWFVGVASEALVFALSAFWYRKYPSLAFVVFAGILYTGRWFLYAVAPGPMTVILLQSLHGITFGVFYLAAFDYIARLIPSFLQATGHLLFMSVFFGFSGIVGSLLGGIIFDLFSGATLYFANGCVAFIGTLCLTVIYLNQRKAVQQTT